MRTRIPVSKEEDPLLEIDRDARKLEVFLMSQKPSLSVGDLRTFLPCTINVDPYLRKLIRGTVCNYFAFFYRVSTSQIDRYIATTGLLCHMIFY